MASPSRPMAANRRGCARSMPSGRRASASTVTASCGTASAVATSNRRLRRAARKRQTALHIRQQGSDWRCRAGSSVQSLGRCEAAIAILRSALSRARAPNLWSIFYILLPRRSRPRSAHTSSRRYKRQERASGYGEPHSDRRRPGPTPSLRSKRWFRSPGRFSSFGLGFLTPDQMETLT